MRDKSKYILSIPMSIIVLAAIIISTGITTFADNTPYTFDKDGSGTLTIDYKDDLDGNDPVIGARFDFYKVADIGSYGEYISLIDDIDLTSGETIAADCGKILKAYEKEGDGFLKKSEKTGADGTFDISLPFGVYLCVESEAAACHLPSTPFVCQLPYMDEGVWRYDVTACPKPIKTGFLGITKTVSGNAASSSDVFNFKVVFEDETDREYIVTDRNNTEHAFKSGQSVALSGGQKAVIKGIPEGVKYTVTEVEANSNGYTTTSTNATGNITAFKETTAAFVNTKNIVSTGTPPVRTGETTHTVMYAMLCIVALCLMIIILICKKRARKMRDKNV